MAELETNAELQKDEAQFAEEEHRRMIASLIVGGLIAGGIFLVIFAEGFGRSFAQFAASAPGGSYSSGSYSLDEAQAAANTYRILGVMSFLGGLAERIVLVIKSKQSS
jgi:hypothetical protein